MGEIDEMELYKMVINEKKKKVLEFFCYNEKNDKLSHCLNNDDSLQVPVHDEF